jgi:hypothetical protein
LKPVSEQGEVAEQVDAMVSKTIWINSSVGSSPTLPINYSGQWSVVSQNFADNRPLTIFFMPKPAINFNKIPKSTATETSLTICLKCAFDFFINELNLSPGQVYSELLNHTPETTDFSGAATARPHFFDTELQSCPFCNASKSWFAKFQAFRIYAYPSFAEQRKKLWAKLEAQTGRFALYCPEQTGMELFSAWLDELKQKVGFDNPYWWRETVIASISFFQPSFDWDSVSGAEIHKVQFKTSLTKAWAYTDGILQIAAIVYGDALIIDHLIARSIANRKRPGERRLQLPELMNRLRRIGYLKIKNIISTNDHQTFEHLLESLVASSPLAVYYAVDRKEYLRRLKIVYKKYTD